MNRQTLGFVVLLLLFAPLRVAAQGFDQQPPGLAWRKIETSHFEVVFPAEIEPEGQRVANLLEQVLEPLGKTLPRKSRRISVILMNQLTVSNGYVTFQPRYAGFYSVPPQSVFAGLTDWYTLLATHEGRHMTQADKLNRGFTRVGGLLFGDAGRFAFSFLAMPMWFWEGDAVATETSLTRSGRGRQPSFDLDLRAPILDGRRYSYYKHYFGSYKDWTANVYSLGYPMTARARRERGPLVWSRVANRSSSWSFWPFAFNGALKREYGKGPVGLYRDTTDELGALWKRQLATVEPTRFRRINPEGRRTFSAYVFPQYDADGSIIAQKYGYDEPTAMVRISAAGQEERLTRFAPHQLLGTRGSLAAGTIAWDETVPDLRWGLRDYAEIVTFDVAHRRARRVTHRSKLLNPALSPDGARIAAVEFSLERKCTLVVLDARSGKELQRLPNPDDDVLVGPSWSEDGTRLVLTRQGLQGRALSLVSLADGTFRDVLPRGWEDVTQPILHGRYVYYGSPRSGIDNIYAVDLETGRRFRVTSSRLGAYFPCVSPDGTKLLYSDYTVRGHDIVEIDLRPETWQPLEEVADDSFRYYEPLVAQEQGGPITDTLGSPSVRFPVKTYHPMGHALCVHSWTLVPGSPASTLQFLSNDKMNTLALSTSLNYYSNERVASVGIEGTYKGLFPQIRVGASYGGRSSTLEQDAQRRVAGATGGSGAANADHYSWRETEVHTGVGVPLNLSRGTTHSTLELAAETRFTRISDKEHVGLFENGNGDLLGATYSASFVRIRNGAHRDVRPVWGQRLDLSYSHTPFAGDYQGALLHGGATVYLPGLARHHAFTLSGGYEAQEPVDYLFASRLPFTRGYDAVIHRRLITASADYGLPIADPDLALGPLLYVKRIKGNLFFDYGRGSGGGAARLYRSAGAELLFESHVFSLPASIDVGVRYAYCLDPERSIGGRRHQVGPIIGLRF